MQRMMEKETESWRKLADEAEVLSDMGRNSSRDHAATREVAKDKLFDAAVAVKKAKNQASKEV